MHFRRIYVKMALQGVIYMKEKILLFLFTAALGATVLCALTYGVLQILIFCEVIVAGVTYDRVLLVRDICFNAFLILGVLTAISGFVYFKIVKK